jgi:hypothetical protein
MIQLWYFNEHTVRSCILSVELKKGIKQCNIATTSFCVDQMYDFSFMKLIIGICILMLTPFLCTEREITSSPSE